MRTKIAIAFASTVSLLSLATSASANTSVSDTSMTKLFHTTGRSIGDAVVTDGDWAAVGNPSAVAPAIPSVLVYRRTPAGWELYQELFQSDYGLDEAAQNFGASLSMDGGTLAIGAWKLNLACNDSGQNCMPVHSFGGAYVFSLEQDDLGEPLWVETAILTPDPPADLEELNFGSSITVSNGIVSVGSVYNGIHDGYVFIFDHDPVTQQWDHFATIVEPLPSEEHFAKSVASQGDTLVIGAPAVDGDDSGSVYVYQLDPIAETATLAQVLPPIGFGDAEEYGWSVDISGDNIVTGSREDSLFDLDGGLVYVWQLDASDVWSLAALLMDPASHAISGFGISSISIRGNTIVTGASSHDDASVNAGAVFPFYRSGQTWVRGGPIVTGDSDPGDAFGAGVALEADGMALFAGATGDDGLGWAKGAVYHVELGYTCDGVLATVLGTEADDDLLGTNGHDVVVLFGGNDIYHGLNGNDRICGGTGDDDLAGNLDNDRVFGEDGFDLLDGDAGNDYLDGGRDNDTIEGGAGGDTITGGFGDDTIEGNEEPDIINGDAGNDTIDGNDGRDSLSGGPGVDDIDGGDDPDVLSGGDDPDTLRGGDGNDLINGDNGNDHLYGDWGDDTLNGDAGNDLVSGGIGTNTCDGGAGTDTAYFCQTAINFP